MGTYHNKQYKNREIKEDFYNPYSFVPLSDKVMILQEEEIKLLEKCHDYPFKNGFCGCIRVRFQAQTPFCVRSSEGRNERINQNQFFIPSTSLKGMVRNVFEIITLSNIRNYIANSRYSMRDLRSSDYKLKEKGNNPKAGFLIRFKNKHYIIPCPGARPYTYEKIQEKEDVNIKGMSIDKKYEALKSGYISEKKDDTWCMWFFSGHINNKKHEYLLDLPTTIENNNLIPVEEQEWNDFIFIHEKENKNANWRFWKKKIKNYQSIEEVKQDEYKGLVPCFFRSRKTEDENLVIKDFGLSFLYRQPYQKRIHDCLKEEYSEGGIDMAQAVFGYTAKNSSLKGRVQFSNSFLSGSIKEEREETFILGSPKPTFYPFYLTQSEGTKLSTYFSDNPIISGWKRPLVHQTVQKGQKMNKRSESSFIPIAAGAEFELNIKVHNLRDFEIGALLSAITFHNRKECCHSLGYAKAFGYGKIKVEDIMLQITPNDPSIKMADVQIDEFISIFEQKLLNHCEITKEEWMKSIRPLFVLAAGNYKKAICYPDLNSKEFESIKKQKKGIKNFSPKIE